MKTFCLTLLLLLSTRAFANYAPTFEEGGRVACLDPGSTSIQLVREKIVMDFPSVTSREYLVTADFVFRNRGAATTAMMGFSDLGTGHYYCSQSTKRFYYRVPQSGSFEWVLEAGKLRGPASMRR
jgi:hypothetical protein